MSACSSTRKEGRKKDTSKEDLCLLQESKGHGLTSGDPLQKGLGRGQAEVSIG